MDEKLRILLCEDDENLGMLLREYLQAKGYAAELYPDGEAGYKAFLKNKYDLCVFDVMMPKKDGFTLAQEVRAANAEIPIIFLTAKTLKEDILEGFKIGADDYITKPFSMEELTFRIEAILRRVRGKKNKESSIYKIGKFTFDTQKQILSTPEKQTKLTTKESELLGLLCAHANEILQRDFALKTIWIDDNYFNARSMDVYITKLRKHLKEATDLTTGSATSYQHIWPLFRYAEVLLNYAEALLEATKEPDFKGTLDNVQYTVSPREAVNMIRTRVDMNAVETTGYDAFKKRLRNERRVELAFEGHRFWDIRRWMTGTSTTRIEGLSITAVKDESGEGYIYSYEKKTVQERIWEERMNYYPIQDVELFKNHNLVQNEGWESN